MKSGLRILIQEDHSSPVVAIATVVAAGQSADPPGQEGLAHLVEHLTYARIDQRLKRAGASYNAITGIDRTVFFALARREQVDELIAIEGERIRAPLEGLAQEMFDTERDVVRNEQRQRGGDRRALAEVFKRAFPDGHPLARNLPAGGNDLTALTVASAQEFANRHYQPANVVVVIAGDVKPDQIAALVSAWPPSILGPTSGGSTSPAAARRASRLPEESDALQRVPVSTPGRSLYLVWRLPPERRSDDVFVGMSLAALSVKLERGGWSRAQAGILDAQAGSLITISLPLRLREGRRGDEARLRRAGVRGKSSQRVRCAEESPELQRPGRKSSWARAVAPQASSRWACACRERSGLASGRTLLERALSRWRLRVDQSHRRGSDGVGR
ncbi:MAG TPA: insulinase family protein [Polyangia bacterium]